MYDGKRLLAVTLARGGSKSIPRKNLIEVAGKPLIAHTIEEVLLVNCIDRYIVSTDDEEIASIARSLGAEVPFLRPSELARDESTSADALLHAVKFLASQGDNYDYVVELMATNPLKRAIHIRECVELAVDNDDKACVAVHKLSDHHPSRIKHIDDGYLRNFYPEVPESRRQDLKPDAYIRSGSIYVTETDFLLANQSRYGEENTRAYVLPSEYVVNIDEPDDLYLAERKLENIKGEGKTIGR